jgi:hypothetical protein
MENMYLVSPGQVRLLRIAYSLIHLLGDIGGVHQTIVGVFGILFFSISKFSFTLSLIKKYFLIETKEKDLFKPKEKNPLKRTKGVEKYSSRKIDQNEEIVYDNPSQSKFYHKVTISTFQTIKLYFVK